jgi:hypothetical protein
VKIFFKLAVLMVVASASISYFKFSREIQGVGSANPGSTNQNSTNQSYVVVDDAMWQHSRPDLADVRLYAGNQEVPYALVEERGSSENAEKEVRVLQPGSIGGKTRFFLDMAGLTEYDRIILNLAAKDFVIKARVEGQDDLHGAHWVALAQTVLYDLSSDGLGNNRTLRLPLTTYKYLRITLDGQRNDGQRNGGIKPADVQGAAAAVRQEQKAVWREIGSSKNPEQHGKDTLLAFSLPANVPVERVSLEIDPGQPNFRREIEVLAVPVKDGQDVPVASGEISRVHMVRNRQKIDVEKSTLDLRTVSPETLKIVIHNGDDRPLKITGAHLEQYQRRIYFQSPNSSPSIYYGDEKLEAPVYDYAKLFQQEPKAISADLGPERTNSAYTGRPDDRPWSEQHPAILWVAIVAAVLILGGIAIRSMKTAARA